ncbi:MAG: FxsA family protein [Nocardiopsaceae bacterium]|nr:FxsA family protein [Nocardiopsaceae bacterium]
MLLRSLLAVGALLVAEICVIAGVAHAIGGVWTVVALIASTAAGLWLARAERRRAWKALREAAADGAVSGRHLGDTVLIFAGGVLIAIPGFVTDALGLLAVAPVTRPAMRRLLGFFLLPRIATLVSPGPAPEPPSDIAPGDVTPGEVVPGEVVD